MLTDNARLENTPPPLDLTRISKSCLKRNERSEFPEKQKLAIPRETNPAT